MSINRYVRYDLVMIVTYQSQQKILSFLASINKNSSVKLFVVLLNQETTFRLNQSNINNVIVTIDIRKSGLSKARNIGLEYLKKNGFDCEYIMFPDDDSTFDENFFLNFSGIKDSRKNYITPIYIVGTKKMYMGKPSVEGRLINENRHSYIGSPNQIINFDINKQDILFDEHLGAGTPLGSCEDYDLFLKLSQKGQPYFFTNKLYSYHPPKTDAYNGLTLATILRRFKSYSSGFSFIIFKYRKYEFIPNYLFRSLAASVYFMIKLNFKLGIAYFFQFYFRLALVAKYTFKQWD